MATQNRLYGRTGDRATSENKGLAERIWSWIWSDATGLLGKEEVKKPVLGSSHGKCLALPEYPGTGLHPGHKELNNVLCDTVSFHFVPSPLFFPTFPQPPNLRSPGNKRNTQYLVKRVAVAMDTRRDPFHLHWHRDVVTMEAVLP